MGRYIQTQEIQDRTIGKIKIVDNPDPEDSENVLSKTLASALIDEAEAEVELDLMVRYMVPIQGPNSERYSQMKDLYPTAYMLIKSLCRLKAVSKLLETDFGRGTIVNADEYKKDVDGRYKRMVDDRILKKMTDMGDTQQWLYPPIPGLMLAIGNRAGDDGYRGSIIVTGDDRTDRYAADQINDPAQTYFGLMGECDEGS